MAARQYSSTVAVKTLSAAMDASVATMTLDSTSTVPLSYPFTMVIDPDTAYEEIVTVTGAPTGYAYPVTRGQDGTTATSHLAGSVVKHMITARDLQEPQDHINATTAVHGLVSADGDIVATTKTQELTNKTIGSSNNIKSGVTLTNNGTISGGTINATTLQKGSSNVVTVGDVGTVTNVMILDGTITDSDINASAAIAKTKISGTAVTLADTGTVTSTMIADGTIVNADVNASAAIAYSKLSGVAKAVTNNPTTATMNTTAVSLSTTVGASTGTLASNRTVINSIPQFILAESCYVMLTATINWTVSASANEARFGFESNGTNTGTTYTFEDMGVQGNVNGTYTTTINRVYLMSAGTYNISVTGYITGTHAGTWTASRSVTDAIPFRAS